MQINQREKSIILLVIASLLAIWGLFSFFSYIFFSTTSSNSAINKIINKENNQWFNVSRPLEVSDLEDRVILLDFWTYACVSCIQALPEIKKLEKEFGSKLTVIGIHSGKTINDKDPEEIRKAILKYDISHPVINDADAKIWDSFAVKSWPTFVLINIHGRVVKTYSGANAVKKMKIGVKKLISKFKYQINRDLLPIVLEKNFIADTVLTFPTKLEYVNNFSYKSRQFPVLFIANSGQNNIIVSSLSGDIIAKIGSKREGFEDGTFEAASFSNPQGMIYNDGKLYIADSGNHALRVVDFKSGMVSTLIGSGMVGKIVDGNGEVLEAKNFDLSSPSDLEFFPDKNNIVIANSGTNQILSYNITKQTISVLAGNGEEGMFDGKENNSLAQTSDLAVYGNKLYFLDAKSNSLRVIDEKGEVKTLIGVSLLKFGHVNGDKNQALMQHPLGLMVDDTGIYISDSFNHVIRKYDFSSKQIRDLVGGKARGDGIGSAANTHFDEPNGIASVLDRLYIADSNNNRIISVSRGNFNSELLDIMPPLKISKEGFLEYLPNLQKLETAKVKADSEIMVKINLNKGWKINDMGPSFVNLLEVVKDNEANLIESLDWHKIQNKEMKLPKLSKKKDYILQGTIYYCQDKKNALCYIKSYEQKITVDADVKGSEIEIKLGY